MIVLILERVPVGLRGELSRWMIEPKANVFIGKVSAVVRDKLWELVCEKSRNGAAMLAYPSPNEQGFVIRSHGDPRRELIDWEGLMLVRIPEPPPKPTKEVDKTANQTE